MTHTIAHPAPARIRPDADRLASLRGRIIDLDAHIMPPPELIEDILGPDLGQSAADLLAGTMARAGAADFEELMALTALDAESADMETVWQTRSWGAFGAFDPDDRLIALDLLGIERQLVLHTAMWDPQYIDSPAAQVAASRHNDWMLDWASGSGGRLLPPAILNAHDRVAAVAETRRALRRGHRAVQLPCYSALFGTSPADPANDALWAELDAAEAPVLLHLFGSEGLVDHRFGATGDLEATPMGGGGEDLGPFGFTTMHVGAELFLTALVLGGVLARFPHLCIAVTELGAGWVGPWAERLDHIARTDRCAMPDLDELPSAYIADQVRVTPIYGEPVGEMVDRYGLGSVYAFSSDFPHKEGGKDPVERFAASLSEAPDDALERFFVTNADRWVQP